MAITKAVTIKSVEEDGEQFQGDILISTVNLLVKDDAVTLIDKDFSATYKKVDDKTVDEELAVWSKNIKNQMQAEINSYINEQNLSTNAKLDTSRGWIESNIDITGI